MKVMKFGGTSVGSPESILNLKQIVGNASRPADVVVSALGGVTDSLIKASREAAAGDGAYLDTYAALVERHHRMILDVIPAGDNRDRLMAQTDALLEELGSIFKGVSLIQDLTPKTADTIVAYGERLSSLIVTSLIPDAVRHDAPQHALGERADDTAADDPDLPGTLSSLLPLLIPIVLIVINTSSSMLFPNNAALLSISSFISLIVLFRNVGRKKIPSTSHMTR